MKWVFVNQFSPSIKKYQLTEGDNIKLVLKYNPEQRSVRVSGEESHRLFFIDKTGLWHNKTILKNEYGVEIGRLSYDKMQHIGAIEIDREVTSSGSGSGHGNWKSVGSRILEDEGT